MTQKYYQTEETRELQILSALSDCTATNEQIQEVVNDIKLHLSTAAGTLQNYNGRFKKAGLKALQDNYQLFTNEEYYTAQKIAPIFNSLTERIIAGKKITIPPAILKMIIDYIQGINTLSHNIVDNVKYVSIGYELAETGNFSLPQNKADEKNI